MLITYDRNSNITAITDNVFDNYDYDFEMDDLNRLTREEIADTSGTRYDHELTYTQSGAIDLAMLDLDNDGFYSDPGEWEDNRTFNKANELIGRDTDNDSTDDNTPAYDDLGNMTDDDQYNTYEYDVWGRPRFVHSEIGPSPCFS